LCDRFESCLFYTSYKNSPTNSKLHQLLIQTYCEGDLHGACRRKVYEVEMAAVPSKDFGPNGYNVDTQRRIY